MDLFIGNMNSTKFQKKMTQSNEAFWTIERLISTATTAVAALQKFQWSHCVNSSIFLK